MTEILKFENRRWYSSYITWSHFKLRNLKMGSACSWALFTWAGSIINLFFALHFHEVEFSVVAVVVISVCNCFLLSLSAAVQSVFPQLELGSFMTIPKVEKEKQMKELTYISTGIRLFNWSCDQGGAGIDNRKFVGVKSKLKSCIWADWSGVY